MGRSTRFDVQAVDRHDLGCVKVKRGEAKRWRR